MAKATVKYTKKAVEDLDEISAYYSPESKQIKIIFDRIDDLKEQPLRGRPVPELNDSYVRQINAKNYRIIYHVVAEYLLIILRVFSYKRQFDPDEELDFNN